jgi:hypothetical protein
MFDLGQKARLDFLGRVSELPLDFFQIQRTSLARHHHNVPIHLKIVRLSALFYTAIARIFGHIRTPQKCAVFRGARLPCFFAYVVSSFFCRLI